MPASGRSRGNVVYGSVEFEIGDGRIIAAGKISINMPSIAALTSGVGTGTVTGLISTDTIVGIPPAGINIDLVFQGARVSATDTIEFRVRNEHATLARDDAAIDYSFIAIRAG